MSRSARIFLWTERIRDIKTVAGYALFLVLIMIAAAAAFIAFCSTGEKGIEERFSDAVGLHGGEPAHGTGEGTLGAGEGFSLKGSPLLYSVALIVLAAACVFAYRRFRC